MALAPEQLGAYITACLFACAAAYERFVNRKKALKVEQDQGMLSEAMAFKERGDLMLKMADDYKILLEKEYAAHQVTREFHHEQAKLSQQKLSECNERCQDLQSKTDLSRIEEILIRQSVAMTQMAEGIRELLTRK